MPPCVPGKVTGEIKYAEDYKAEGMVFARLLTSPMPSGRVVNIDASEALRMDGVVGIFTADDLPPVAPPANPALASDYITYVGQPILAVAATSEEIAEMDQQNEARLAQMKAQAQAQKDPQTGQPLPANEQSTDAPKEQELAQPGFVEYNGKMYP